MILMNWKIYKDYMLWVMCFWVFNNTFKNNLEASQILFNSGSRSIRPTNLGLTEVSCKCCKST